MLDSLQSGIAKITHFRKRYEKWQSNVQEMAWELKNIDDKSSNAINLDKLVAFNEKFVKSEVLVAEIQNEIKDWIENFNKEYKLKINSENLFYDIESNTATPTTNKNFEGRKEKAITEYNQKILNAKKKSEHQQGMD
jgi:glutaredoxin 2